MGRPYHPPAVLRAVRILQCLSGAPRPLRLTDLSRRVGLGKSTVHGILSALEEVEWVERVPEGRGFRLGKGLGRWLWRAFGPVDLPHLARPFMERLAQRIGESVFVGMPQGDRMMILSCIEGRNELRVSSPPGTTLPLMAAATAKVYLSSLPREEAEKILRSSSPLPAFTERSILDPERFLQEVDETRVRGYAIDDEEYLRGVRAVAAPVKVHGELVAILWTVGFSSRLDARAMERAGLELVEAASLLSRLLETREGRENSFLCLRGK